VVWRWLYRLAETRFKLEGWKTVQRAWLAKLAERERKGSVQ